MNLIISFLACLCFLQFAVAQDCTTFPTQNAFWNISEKVTANGERFIAVNDIWPAKALVYKKCTKLVLKVQNSLPQDSVSLHWHGLLQKNGSTMMDGVIGLTQSGIAPQQTFTYTVILDKEGTNWVHSHSPGQYPQGLRAPLIVLPQNAATTNIGDEIVTLSDWWPDFKVAEARSLATDSSTCGTQGLNSDGSINPATRNVGIELPPDHVTFNDVDGHNKTISNKSIKVTCDTPKKIRFINISSQSRFYVAFSDGRDFQITELDGVAYAPTTTSWLELASGQRASIIVNGRSISGGCASAYILGMSDPKVNAGTANCPMTSTNANFKTQWTHGQLIVNNQPTTRGNFVLTPGVDFPTDWARKWNEQTQETSDTTMNNRLKIPYKSMYFNSADPNIYGPTPDSTKTSRAIMAVDRADELTMVPSEPMFQWRVPENDKANHMHYFALDHLKDGVNPPSQDETGYAAMAEYPSKNAYTKWKSPAGDDSYWSGRTQKDLPSLYRALRDGAENSEIMAPETYYSDPTSQKGKTTVFNDNNVHWFIIQSMRGDHPMHLHGHHFQVLAKLPKTWFAQNYNDLYTHVTNGVSSIGKADINNPPRRDTLFIDKEFTYVIAIQADNPGVWAFHCHNDIHAVSGMFAQIIERPVDLRATLGSWDFGPVTKGKGLMRWFTSSQSNLVWRSTNTTGDWMVANFNTALKRYGWNTMWTGFNTKNPSKWDIKSMKRWLPRGAAWY